MFRSTCHATLLHARALLSVTQSSLNPGPQYLHLPIQGGDALGEEASADANADRLVRDALSRAHKALPPAKSPVRTPRCAHDHNTHERTYEVRFCYAY